MGHEHVPRVAVPRVACDSRLQPVQAALQLGRDLSRSFVETMRHGTSPIVAGVDGFYARADGPAAAGLRRWSARSTPPGSEITSTGSTGPRGPSAARVKTPRI